ncbi:MULTISPECIES: hypothetical protein [Myxococcaceae]|uniref:hypothetical protein n=1 Tax=Myxococcaceae TaxID=31 RepID=UPI001890922F|nr:MULTISPECIES: hypothetical protein [Myxococcaceae]MBF5044681.1 hypothetical protein [Simulacricoccus sp. 17bor-14]
MQHEEDAGGSLNDRRHAQMHAQPFESFGDGKLQQEIKVLPPGTGGSGTVPGSGTMAGPAAKQLQEQTGSSNQAASPVWRMDTGGSAQPAAGTQGATPHRDSGSSEKN